MLLNKMESLGIAFSGGVDSTFLLKVASKVLPGRVSAYFVKSVLLSDGEPEAAQMLAADIGVPLHVIEFDPLSLEAFRANPVERCYLCKKEIYTLLRDKANADRCRVLADGTNADDLKVFRPGLKAAAELFVSSPLAEEGFTKDEIRQVSRKLGLPTWNKPSAPCLATRFPYGQKLTLEKLKRVSEAETYLYGLGYRQSRVRHIEDWALIEIEKERINEFLAKDQECGILEYVRRLGFAGAGLDPDGYRCGRFD